MSRAHWEHFPHAADIGIRGIGPTEAAAFEQAAQALTAIVVGRERIAPESAVPIACEAPDDELLLVDWLNALIYEMASRRMVFGRFAVAIADHRLRATAWGEPVARHRDDPGVEVKGATMTALRVGRRADGTWLAQCVVDV